MRQARLVKIAYSDGFYCCITRSALKFVSRNWWSGNIIFVILSSVFSLLMYSCYEPDPDEITDRYCSFYRPDYATIDIRLEYKYFDGASPVRTAVVKMYNWSPDGRLTVNDLDGGRLTINGIETSFKDSTAGNGFYPTGKGFSLVPDKLYTIIFEHDSSTYEFGTMLPPKFDDFNLPVDVDMTNDLTIRLNSKNNDYKETTIKLAAINPDNRSDTLWLIKNEVFAGDEFTVPFKFLASSIAGWEAELTVKRIHNGYYDLSFLNDSRVTGTCIFYKKFNLLDH